MLRRSSRFSIATSKVFTSKHVEEYKKNGATLVENVLSSQEVDAMLDYTRTLVDKSDIFKNIVIFLGREDSRGSEFLKTGDKTHFFFEEHAFDNKMNLTVPKEHVLNKIGHAMHDLDEFYQKFSYQPLYKHILKEIGYVDPTLVQSMYIFKNPRIGGEVTI